MHFPQCAQYLPNLLNLKIVKDLQRIEESIFSDTYFTVKRAFVAILTSTYLLQFTRFTRLLRCTPSRTGYDKSSTPQDKHGKMKKVVCITAPIKFKAGRNIFNLKKKILLSIP